MINSFNTQLALSYLSQWNPLNPYWPFPELEDSMESIWKSQHYLSHTAWI